MKKLRQEMEKLHFNSIFGCFFCVFHHFCHHPSSILIQDQCSFKGSVELQVLLKMT